MKKNTESLSPPKPSNSPQIIPIVSPPSTIGQSWESRDENIDFSEETEDFTEESDVFTPLSGKGNILFL
jgi:hypothetical protein